MGCLEYMTKNYSHVVGEDAIGRRTRPVLLPVEEDGETRCVRLQDSAREEEVYATSWCDVSLNSQQITAFAAIPFLLVTLNLNWSEFSETNEGRFDLLLPVLITLPMRDRDL